MNTSKAGASPFEEFTEQYDAWYDSKKGKILYENEKKCIEKLLYGCKEVLEIGVGTARFALLTHKAFGVDVAFAPLKIAKKRGIHVIQARAEELPIKENSFSCVMFIVTMPFIKDLTKALSEAKRVLKDDGKIIICDVFKESELGKLYEEKKKQGHPFYSHATFYEFEEFIKILTERGLKIKKIFGTLKKSSSEEPVPEEPEEVKNFNEIPGFLCIEVAK